MLKRLALPVAASLLLASAAFALPARDNEMIYFADKTMKKEIGSFYLSCSGRQFRSGKTSKHYIRYQMACEGSGLSSMGPNCYTLDGVMAVCSQAALDAFGSWQDDFGRKRNP